MILGNPVVIVQDMLRKAPETLNAVDVVLAARRAGLAVIQAVVFAPALERVVAAKCIGVIDRSFPRRLPDMRRRFVGGHSFHQLGVHLPVALNLGRKFVGVEIDEKYFKAAAQRLKERPEKLL